MFTHEFRSSYGILGTRATTDHRVQVTFQLGVRGSVRKCNATIYLAPGNVKKRGEK